MSSAIFASSSATFASQFGYRELFEYFDYTAEGSEAWKLYA